MITANDINKEMLNIHKLKNGALVMGISGHGFRFSDGTACGAQNQDITDSLTLTRQFALVKHIAGMSVNEVKMILTEPQQQILQKLSEFTDLIIVPFPVLSSLKEQGIRHLFPKCVAFNATPETARALPQDKIVDVNNWSW